MSDDRVLGFIDDEDDHEMASRVRSAYSSAPAATAGQIADCIAYVVQAARKERRAGGFGRRWWWGAAAAAALLAVVTLRPVRLDDGGRASVDSATASNVLPTGSTTVVASGAIRFDLRLPPGAREVAIVGDFNGWDTSATPMKARTTDGTWSAEVPLRPGVHTYAFVVDGQRWMVDPLAPQLPDAGFGGPTNAVVVGTQ